MAVNEITKNFLVYAIRDFFIRGGSCHAVLEYVFPKKIYYPNILHNTIKRRDFIFSRFKKYPVYLIKKKHYLYLKSTFALYNYNAFSYLIIFINLIYIHLLRHHFLLLHHRYLYYYETLQMLLVQK